MLTLYCWPEKPARASTNTLMYRILEDFQKGSKFWYNQYTVEYPSTLTICISVMVNIRVKLQKVHHIQLPRSLKNPIQFDNKQFQVHTNINLPHYIFKEILEHPSLYFHLYTWFQKSTGILKLLRSFKISSV